jgi:hypothetical protein
MALFNTFIPTVAQYKKWSLPTKWGFWSALIGIPTGILGLLLGVMPLLNDSGREVRSNELFKAAQELRYNREYLFALSQSFTSMSSSLPPGSIKADALIHVFDKHFGLVTNDAYGEQKHLYQLGLTLKDLGAQISSVSRRTELNELMRSSEFSVGDLLFLNDFLLWYLKPILSDELTLEQKSAFGPLDLPTDTFAIHGSKAVHLKYFQADGRPLSKFVDYLGLID